MRRTADAPADAEHRHRSDISWKTLGIATATEHGALSDAAIATERSRAMRGNISSDGPGHGVVGIMSGGSHLCPAGGQVPRAQCTADSPGSLASDRSQILRAQGTAGSPGSLANDRSQVAIVKPAVRSMHEALANKRYDDFQDACRKNLGHDLQLHQTSIWPWGRCANYSAGRNYALWACNNCALVAVRGYVSSRVGSGARGGRFTDYRCSLGMRRYLTRRRTAAAKSLLWLKRTANSKRLTLVQRSGRPADINFATKQVARLDRLIARTVSASLVTEKKRRLRLEDTLAKMHSSEHSIAKWTTSIWPLHGDCRSNLLYDPLKATNRVRGHTVWICDVCLAFEHHGRSNGTWLYERPCIPPCGATLTWRARKIDAMYRWVKSAMKLDLHQHHIDKLRVGAIQLRMLQDIAERYQLSELGAGAPGNHSAGVATFASGCSLCLPHAL